MAGLVDYEAVVLDLRGALRERASWGRAQVLGLIDDLEQAHRISESADAATLRRFSGHLTDTFFGLLPDPATELPLAADDRMTESFRHSTSAAMDEGAASDHPPHGGDACPAPPTHPTHPSSRPTPDFPPAASPPARLANAAT